MDFLFDGNTFFVFAGGKGKTIVRKIPQFSLYAAVILRKTFCEYRKLSSIRDSDSSFIWTGLVDAILYLSTTLIEETDVIFNVPHLAISTL